MHHLYGDCSTAILLGSFSYRKSGISNSLHYIILLAQCNSKNKHLLGNIKLGQQSLVTAESMEKS